MFRVEVLDVMVLSTRILVGTLNRDMVGIRQGYPYQGPHIPIILLEKSWGSPFGPFESF